MMKNSKHNIMSSPNCYRPLKLFALSLAATLVLSGCNNGDNDNNEMEQNLPPMTVTVDLITQTETPITDRLSAIDADGDSLSFSLAQQSTLGVVTIGNNGEFTYQPNDELTGSDSFTYTVTDGVNSAVSGRVNITIEALEVSFANYSRAAFNQQASDEPLVINGRVFIQDVDDPEAYDDLLAQ